MKLLISFLFILSSLAITAQDVTGTYLLENQSTNAELSRTLTLKKDGTFEFSGYEKNKDFIAHENTYYTIGTWTQEQNIIIFTTEASNIDDKFTQDFNASKARFNRKSPRDKSDRIIKTCIQFYDTDARILKGLKLFKN